MTKILIEIDGKLGQFDGRYEDMGAGHSGAIWGYDEVTQIEDRVINFKSTKAVWRVNAYRVNADGSRFGMMALFAHGEWAKTPDGEILLRVWNRII